MKKIKVSSNVHNYLKNLSKFRKKSMLDTIEYVIDVFQQVPKHVLLPEIQERKPYKTYKEAFYEQNKHKLHEHERKFFERNKTNMRMFFKQNEKELKIFNATYALSQNITRQARAKENNRKYYLKRKEALNVKGE